MRQSGKTALDNYLGVLGVLKETIKEVGKTLQEKAKVTEEAKWLRSIIGIGFRNALLILSEIGGIGRFSKPESFVSYAGLAPKSSNPVIIQDTGT